MFSFDHFKRDLRIMLSFRHALTFKDAEDEADDWLKWSYLVDKAAGISMFVVSPHVAEWCKAHDISEPIPIAYASRTMVVGGKKPTYRERYHYAIHFKKPEHLVQFRMKWL
jgi:hypothetical protein